MRRAAVLTRLGIGMITFSIGALLNWLVETVNGGMPVLAPVGWAVTDSAHHAASSADRLPLLWDRLVITLGWFQYVLSVGDLVVILGWAIIVWSALAILRMGLRPGTEP